MAGMVFRCRLCPLLILLAWIHCDVVAAQLPGVIGPGIGPGPYKAQHLTLEMISAGPDVAAGGTQAVAFVFSLEEQWHLLWLNSGYGSRQSYPQVSWSLPKDVTADSLQLPAPDRLVDGVTVTYGYADSAAFPVTLHVGSAPATAPDGSISLDAHVTWLVCKKMCVPGQADLRLPLHVVAAGTVVTHEGDRVGQLGESIKGLPAPVPRRFRLAANDFGNQIVLTAVTGTRETDPEFFPATAGQIVDTPKLPVQSLPDGAQIRFVKPGKGVPRRLTGVLKLSREESYWIDVPVQRGPPPLLVRRLWPWMLPAVGMVAAVAMLLVRRRKL